jgi:hypothetical protein
MKKVDLKYVKKVFGSIEGVSGYVLREHKKVRIYYKNDKALLVETKNTSSYDFKVANMFIIAEFPHIGQSMHYDYINYSRHNLTIITWE